MIPIPELRVSRRDYRRELKEMEESRDFWKGVAMGAYLGIVIANILIG